MDNTNIFDLTPPPAPTVADTVAQKILADCRLMTTKLLQLQQEGIDSLWFNAQATPQEILDSLGPTAGKVFDAHAGLTEFLMRLGQLDGIQVPVKLPPLEFVRNEDGTITVVVPPPLEPPPEAQTLPVFPPEATQLPVFPPEEPAP